VNPRSGGKEIIFLVILRQIADSRGYYGDKNDITDRFVLISKRFPSILDVVVGLFLFLSTFIVYLTHLAPSIVTGDSADATIASYVLGIPHPPGFPIYTWFGHIFTFIPLGDIFTDLLLAEHRECL